MPIAAEFPRIVPQRFLGLPRGRQLKLDNRSPPASEKVEARSAGNSEIRMG